MTNHESRRFDMLLRSMGFLTNHRDRFPKGTPAGDAVDALSAVNAKLGEYAVAKRSTTGEGRQAKQAARAALLDYLEKMAQCARLATREVPGFDSRFRIGRLRSDQAILTTAKAFAHDAAASSQLFTKYGMPAAFQTELNGLIQTCDQEVTHWRDARAAYREAATGIESALDEGFALCRRLDHFVANEFGNDPKAMSVWEQERRCDLPKYPRRRKKEPTMEVPVPQAVTPPPIAPPAVAPAPAVVPAPTAAPPVPTPVAQPVSEAAEPVKEVA